ncbi:MAG: hypothetical protein GY810_12585 [Aureispira sp.]|nr:hypothetical protein [Aureispira sp.]
MAKLSDDLFQLIKSLDKLETRYFRRHSTADKKSSMMQLFDLLLRLEYNEKRIVQLFEKKGMAKHISKTKKYLYDSILRVMRSYKSETSFNARYRLFDIFKDIDFLFEKQIDGQA